MILFEFQGAPSLKKLLGRSSKTGCFWRTPPKLVRFGGLLQNWSVLEDSSKIGPFWRRTSGLKKNWRRHANWEILTYYSSSFAFSFSRSPPFPVFVSEESSILCFRFGGETCVRGAHFWDGPRGAHFYSKEIVTFKKYRSEFLLNSNPRAPALAPVAVPESFPKRLSYAPALHDTDPMVCGFGRGSLVWAQGRNKG